MILLLYLLQTQAVYLGSPELDVSVKTVLHNLKRNELITC